MASLLPGNHPSDKPGYEYPNKAAASVDLEHVIGRQLDAGDPTVIVAELRKEQSMKRIYRCVAIGSFVAVLALVGALCGTTFAIVQLTKETKVTTFKDSTFQFLTTSTGQSAVPGGAALDLTTMTYTPDDGRARALADAITGNGGANGGVSSRRRMMEGVSLLNSSWAYVGTLPHNTVALGCSIVSQNLHTFPVATNASLLLNGTTITNIRVLQYSGCGSDGSAHLASALVTSADGGNFTYFIHCNKASGDCDVWKDVTALIAWAAAAGGGDDEAAAGADASSSHQRLLQGEEASESSSGPEMLLQHISPHGIVAERRQLQWWAPGPGWYSFSTNCAPFTFGIKGSTTTIDCSRQSVSSCFPLDAIVEVAGRGVVRMDELQYGDMVRSIDRTTDSVVHRPVYLFGHRQGDGAKKPYVHITTAGGRTVAASPGHFLPVCVAGCGQGSSPASARMENRRAADIRVGDLVGVADRVPALAVVTQIENILAQGAFNPYIRGADLIVDGVRASPHSDWLLDSIAPAWLVPHLPAIYEALLTPVYGLYCIVGPKTAEWLAHGLRLAEGETSVKYGMGYFAVLAGMSAPVVAAVAAAALLASSSPAAALRARAKAAVRAA